MNKEYYREYFDLERNHWWFKARKKILETHIAKLLKGKKARILNIGAATGASSDMLAGFGDVTSVEYDSDCCEFVKEKTGRTFICASITELPFADESFDLVCAFDVIEHVDDDSLSVKEMTRVCRKGGNLIVTVPAYMFLWSHHDVVNQHKRRYTLQGLRNLFREMETLYSGYFNTILFLPISAVRIIDRFFKPRFLRRDAGSDFSIIKNKFLNAVFYQIMISDNLFMRNGLQLPFGVSILLSAKKPGSNAE